MLYNIASIALLTRQQQALDALIIRRAQASQRRMAGIATLAIATDTGVPLNNGPLLFVSIVVRLSSNVVTKTNRTNHAKYEQTAGKHLDNSLTASDRKHVVGFCCNPGMTRGRVWSHRSRCKRRKFSAGLSSLPQTLPFLVFSICCYRNNRVQDLLGLVETVHGSHDREAYFGVLLAPVRCLARPSSGDDASAIGGCFGPSLP